MKQAEKIKKRRINAGYSQETLAEAMDVSRQAVTNWEAGQAAPSSANLRKLAALLDVDASDLLDDPAVDALPARPRWTLPVVMVGAVLLCAALLAQGVIYLISTTQVYDVQHPVSVDALVAGGEREDDWFDGDTWWRTWSERSYHTFVAVNRLEVIVAVLWWMAAAGAGLFVFGASFRWRKPPAPLI